MRKLFFNKLMGECLSPVQFLFMSHCPWLWAFCLTCLCCSFWCVTRAPHCTARPDVSVCSSWACTNLLHNQVTTGVRAGRATEFRLFKYLQKQLYSYPSTSKQNKPSWFLFATGLRAAKLASHSLIYAHMC